MYAIVDTGGKQARVKAGDTIKVELRASAQPGDKVQLPVFLIGAGADVKVGTPVVAGAVVEAEVVGHGKHKKVYHYRDPGRGLGPHPWSPPGLHRAQDHDGDGLTLRFPPLTRRRHRAPSRYRHHGT